MSDGFEKLDGLVSALAGVLEKRRQEVGISQEELAKRAGISRTYLSDIERGLRNISISTLTKLAQAMDITASRILARAEEIALQPAQIRKQ